MSSHHIQNIKDGFGVCFFLLRVICSSFVRECRYIKNRLRPRENTLTLTPFAMMSQNVNRIAEDVEFTYRKT